MKSTSVSKLNKIIYGSIVVLSFLIYGNSIKNGYAIDDGFVTTTNPETPNLRIEKGIKGIPEIFSTHYVESEKQSFEYRPIVLVTYALEYHFFESNPSISHFINVLVYALTCLLLFIVLSNLLRKYHLVLPLLITFLFIVHPIHSEVVNNLKSRDELLSFFFGISSLYFFLKQIEFGKWQNLLLGILFFTLALLSKKTAIIFIAIIPLTIYFFTDAKLKNVLFYGLVAPIVFLCYAITLKFVFQAPGMREYAFFENPLFYEPDFFKRIPMAFYTAGYYLKLLVLPHPLSSYYGFKTISLVSWSSVLMWCSLIFHVALGIYALLGLKKKRIISYGILIYLIGIFPFINLVTPVVGVVGERFIYLASFGFCIGLAYLLLLTFKVGYANKTTKWSYFKLAFKVTTVIILCIYSVKIVSRNSDWKDELTLFRNDVAHFENSCNLNYITANALSNKIAHTPAGVERNALIQEATFYYKKTVELMAEGIKKYPQDYITSNNLGTIYVDIFKDATNAQPLFKKVIETNPDNLEGRYNYGFCYESRNLPDSAITWYEKMLSDQIKYFPAYIRLHDLYYKKQDYNKAIVSGKKVLSLYPEKIELYINLGNSYMLSGDTLSGLEYFEKAAAKPPLDYVLLQNVANVFKTIGNNSKAAEYQEKSKIVMGQTQYK